jgi:predicted Rossmann fold nucleotide-binding protein DprA/Smf involved in DNA uptake
MTLSSTTQAVLLLTAHFSKSGPKDLKPLGPVEWGRFALWLKQQGKSPEDLLTGDLEERLAGLSDKTITVERIKRLLERGSALAIATEKWLRSGLWILTRSDAEYPRILKERLKESFCLVVGTHGF